jgi:pantothenate kinase
MTTLRSVDEVVGAILAAVVPGKRLLVAIAGAPGSGKSTIAADVVGRTPGAALLPMDGFHLPQARLVELGRRDRMGAPDTFDVDGFLRVLTALASARPSAPRAPHAPHAPTAPHAPHENSGDGVSVPGFDREIEEVVPDAEVISPEFSVVVVEGNYLLLDSGGWERAAPLFGLRLFVELDREVRLARLVDRHVRFGKTPDAARDLALGPD